MPLLEVRDLEISFATPEGTVHAVNSVDFDVEAGEFMAIVGESGSGKSQTALAIAGLIAANGRLSGSIRFAGVELIGLPERDYRRWRGGGIGLIFQDAVTALNPYRTIGSQLREALVTHFPCSRREAERRAIAMLEQVRLADPERRLRQYPHELSGGMQQRVMIALALLPRPRLLIADEPTSVLDVTVQADIGALLRTYQQRHDTAVMLITHDLGFVAGLAERVLVMYAGQVMEYAAIDALFHHSEHPYTRGLLRSIPRLDAPADDALHGIPGNPPNPLARPAGCPFRERCPYAFDTCLTMPPLVRAAHGGLKRCHLEALGP